ncbi:MAG: GNAT family N-acetyltransferase [Candidatus Thorarchaeota archaeon]
MRIRSMQQNDIDFALKLTSKEGWTDIPSDFKMLISYSPPAAFVLEDEGKRVGMVSSVAYEKMGFIGSLIVLEEYRRRGFGGTLLKHAIEYLDILGVHQIMLDAVVEAVPMYKSLGFHPVCNSLRMRGTPRHVENSNTRVIQNGDLKEVLNLDRKAFGANRSHFLAYRLSECIDLCYVQVEKDEIQGFIMASDRPNGIRVAPWIVSNPNEHSESLLGAIAASRKDSPLMLGVLESNRPAVKMLQQLGFEQTSHSVRMVRFQSATPKFSDMQYAIGSPAKG